MIEEKVKVNKLETELWIVNPNYFETQQKADDFSRVNAPSNPILDEDDEHFIE